MEKKKPVSKPNQQEPSTNKNSNKNTKTDKTYVPTKNVNKKRSDINVGNEPKKLCHQHKKQKKDNNSASTKTKKSANDGKGDDEAKSCHQCHTRIVDKHRLVECEKCPKRYCTACITKWYPNVSEEELIKACPVCCNICNCKPCLRRFASKDMQPYSCSEPDKIKYSKHILKIVFPLVKELYEDQLLEKEIEAKVKGLSISELQLAECEVDSDIFCDSCGAYFFDLFRRCSCGYGLCLLCCRNFRDCQLLALTYGWKSRVDGSIACLSKDMGGCDNGTLELKRVMLVDRVDNMLDKAKEMFKKINMSFNNVNEFRQEKSVASCLYSVNAKDIQTQDTERFQLHWSKGEPVMVNDVLSTSSGLSWDPMVLLRAIRDRTQNNDHSHSYEANAINCWDWSKVSVNLNKFFNGYSKSQFNKKGYPLILKLEDWHPSCLSHGELPRHFVELINCLPFKDYTHPNNGYLNVAVKLPDLSIKPNMGPTIDVAYGVEEELEYGDSVTKLHYDKSDTVNVLTHTKSAGFTSELLNKNNMVKPKQGDQKCVDTMDGSALWDIFRRQDIPKLEEYLQNHSVDFKHVDRLPVKKVVHPIHDRTFYLNMEHKRKLKEECGIEPWTFKQKLGDAIFIPAGCPYQVKNIKSNMKVELNFVSPESLGECIRFQHELRMLPKNHTAKQQKLNIEKMMIYALDHALANLNGIIESNGSTNNLPFANGPEIFNSDDMNNANNTNGWVCESESDFDSHEPAVNIEDSSTSEETVGVWKEHNVGPEAKKLLEAIEQHYPNTFQGVQIRSNTFWLSNLKELYSVVKAFLETSVEALGKERITSLQEDFYELQRLGFDLSWAHKRLDMVKNLKFGNNPLTQELSVLDESLESVQKELAEAREKLKKVLLKYDNVTHARNKKVKELAQKFGDEYGRVLKGNLGFGILPGY